MIFTGLTVMFLKEFGRGLLLTFPVWLGLSIVITLLGQVVGKKERWSRFDSFYWSFITATTIGYGDIRPLERGSRIISILIGFLGLVMSGIIVSVAVHAGTLALDRIGR